MKSFRKSSRKELEEVKEVEFIIQETMIPLGINNDSDKLCHLISVLQLFPKNEFFKDEVEVTKDDRYMRSIKYISNPNVSTEMRGVFLEENFDLRDM